MFGNALERELSEWEGTGKRRGLGMRGKETIIVSQGTGGNIERE